MSAKPKARHAARHYGARQVETAASGPEHGIEDLLARIERQAKPSRSEAPGGRFVKKVMRAGDFPLGVSFTTVLWMTIGAVAGGVAGGATTAPTIAAIPISALAGAGLGATAGLAGVKILDRITQEPELAGSARRRR